MELLGALKVAFPLGLEAAVIADLGAWEGVQHHPPQPQASECQKNDRRPALRAARAARAARDARDASRNRDLNRQPRSVCTTWCKYTYAAHSNRPTSIPRI